MGEGGALVILDAVDEAMNGLRKIIEMMILSFMIMRQMISLGEFYSWNMWSFQKQHDYIFEPKGKEKPNGLLTDWLYIRLGPSCQVDLIVVLRLCHGQSIQSRHPGMCLTHDQKESIFTVIKSFAVTKLNYAC